MFRTTSLLAGIIALLPLAIAAELQPIEINRAELVEQAVKGVISPPAMRESIYRVHADGEVVMLPGTGSITYNFRTGDSAIRMAGNHVEPAVSLHNIGSEGGRAGNDNRALNALSMIGNRARILSGSAEGAEGWVIGKHGGVEHLMVDFAPDIYDDLAIGNEMQIRTLGGGMRLTNIDGVRVFNTSPDLIDAFNNNGAGVTADGQMRIGVTHHVPARIMGSGLGRDHVFTGDYDIQMFDEETNERYNLESLRFGDIVAIIDADHSYGRIYKSGAVSIGVISHGRSDSAGHGPGVTTLFTSSEGLIEPIIDPDANLKNLLGIP